MPSSGPHVSPPEDHKVMAQFIAIGDLFTAAAMQGDTPLWQLQCRAAARLKEGLGVEVALDYLIGEKFLRFLRTVALDSPARTDLPAFAAGVREIFSEAELRAYVTAIQAGDPKATCGRTFDAVDREHSAELAEQLLRPSPGAAK